MKQNALVVASVKGAKHLIAEAIANYIRPIEKQRIYIAYGTTNSYILSHLGVDTGGYHSGYTGAKGLYVNKFKPDIVILNSYDDEKNFSKKLDPSDIIIKGANALCYKDGAYEVATAIDDPHTGNYATIYAQAVAIGAQVIIPIGHEKMVPHIAKNITQSSFHMSMGKNIALLPMHYGNIYTEIQAFKHLFNVDAEVITAGGIEGYEGAISFALHGNEDNLELAIEFLKKYN
jgi:hypothetical protein